MDPLSITASIIAIIGGINAVSKTIQTIKGLPKAFDEVQRDLPLVLSILRGAQNSLLDGQEISEDEKNALTAVLQPSRDKAEELKRIFDEVRVECEEDKDGRDWAKLRTAYHKALRGVKASRVEHLMMDILEGMKKLALAQVFKSATQHDIQTLEKAIHDLSEVEPSLPDSEFSTDGQIFASQHNASGAIAQQSNVQGGINTFNSGKYVATGTAHTFNYVENKYMASDPSKERPETLPQPSCFVPFRRDPDFVDRGTLLDQIRERCAAPASRVALVGLGGAGKSQLAIEHCYRTAEQSPDTWVFWAHASNTARLEQSFRYIADQVRVRGRKDPHADVFKLVHDWLRDLKNGRWLLVLDNADDAAVLSPKNSGSALQQHLWSYLPPSSCGSVLVTSRTKRAANHIVEDSDIILVKPMDDVAAHALLRKKLGSIQEREEGIAQLAKMLDHMPLALVQAAAYIRERAPRCSVQQYLDEYQKSDSRKTSLLNWEAGHLRRDISASNAVLITWQISFDHIRSTRQSAADLLSLMSFFDRQGIQKALLHGRNTTRDDEFEDDILVLRDFSFIAVTKDVKAFEMHSLVQVATRTWLESKGQLDKWRERFISNLCVELPIGTYENWEKCQALFPHARAALAQRPNNRESLKEWARLLYKAAVYAWLQGRAGEAEQMSVVSMEVNSEVLGEEDERTLCSMGMVGIALALGGKYGEAEGIHRQELALSEKVLGREHPDTLSSMNNLATVLDNQGKYEEAEVIHRQTLALSQRVLGREHLYTLVSMNSLATGLGRQGKYEEAEGIHRQTLALREKVLGREHPSTLTSMNNLAVVLESQGKYKEAKGIYRQTLALNEKVLGRKHPDTLTNVYCLAHLLTSQRRYKEALGLYKRACSGYQAVFGLDHPLTRACQEHYAEALELEQHSQSGVPPRRKDGSVVMRTRKESKLLRGLAKIGIRSSKWNAR